MVLRRMKVIVYKDEVGEFRWKLKAENGEIISDYAEGCHQRVTRSPWLEVKSWCAGPGAITEGYIGLGAGSGLRPDGCPKGCAQRCAPSRIPEAVGFNRSDLYPCRLR
jgi:hypothetical protein